MVTVIKKSELMKHYQEIRSNPISASVILWSFFHTLVRPFCGSNILWRPFYGVIHVDAEYDPDNTQAGPWTSGQPRAEERSENMTLSW